MKKFLVISMAFLAFSGTALADTATGSWSWTGKQEAGGFLKTLQSGSLIRFQLDINIGAPSYNSGYIEGTFKLHDDKGTFQSGTCQLHFTFNKQRAKIEQTGHGCGFGGGVTAAGIYHRTSTKSPKFWRCDPRTGNLCG